MNIRTFSCLCYALCLAACGWAQGVSFSGNVPQAVSAPFAGVSGDYLLLAGGCNFPDVPASEGGVKQYYTAVWAKQADQAWRCVGSLPEETAYGASITLPEGVDTFSFLITNPRQNIGRWTKQTYFQGVDITIAYKKQQPLEGLCDVFKTLLPCFNVKQCSRRSREC